MVSCGMNRRDFLGASLAGPMAGLAVLAAACGGDDGVAPIDAAPSCLQNGTVVAIASNHGHSMLVSIADIQAGQDKTYELGGSDHTHTVTLTARNFGLLAGDQPVPVRSTVDAGHSHAINVRCA